MAHQGRANLEIYRSANAAEAARQVSADGEVMAPAILAAPATPIRATDVPQNPSADIDSAADSWMDAEGGSDKPMTLGDHELTSLGNSDCAQDMTMHLENLEACELAQREAADRVVCDATTGSP